MLSGQIAIHLRDRGLDVVEVVKEPSLVGLSDEQLLAAATVAGRAVVTKNVKDFVPLDNLYKASGRGHAGIVLISSKTFPQDRSFIGSVTVALERLVIERTLAPDAVAFLRR